jgi:hypothetical protein
MDTTIISRNERREASKARRCVPFADEVGSASGAVFVAGFENAERRSRVVDQGGSLQQWTRSDGVETCRGGEVSANIARRWYYCEYQYYYFYYYTAAEEGAGRDYFRPTNTRCCHENSRNPGADQ